MLQQSQAILPLNLTYAFSYLWLPLLPPPVFPPHWLTPSPPSRWCFWKGFFPRWPSAGSHDSTLWSISTLSLRLVLSQNCCRLFRIQNFSIIPFCLLFVTYCLVLSGHSINTLILVFFPEYSQFTVGSLIIQRKLNSFPMSLNRQNSDIKEGK